MTNRPLVLPFPLPEGPELGAAYEDLHLAAHGDDETKATIGDPALLPRPWDPATCRKRKLREELWEWLDAVVNWFNTEYVWDQTAGMIPLCWPQHPHLVHEIAVLADQRRRAGVDTSSNTLEEWHRYTVPAFLDRLRHRTRSHCDEHHQPWPARTRYARHVAEPAFAERQQLLQTDARGDTLGQRDDGIMRLVSEEGDLIDPATRQII